MRHTVDLFSKITDYELRD